MTFLTVMPSPYTLDLFAAIEADGRIVPRVLYMEMAAPDTHWGSVPLPASATILDGGWRSIGGGRVHWNPGVIRAIRESSPDVVVVAGYSSITTQIAMRWLRWRRIPWIFWGEVPGMRRLHSWGTGLRALARYPAIAWPDAIAAIGTVAVNEYRRLAHARCEVANIPYFTDLAAFQRQPRSESTSVRLLYCGQLIERKGVGDLLGAFLSLADELPQLTLRFVGDGPLKESLSAQVPDRLASRVDFAGFQPVEKLPEFFAAADVFVLPSRHDGWGVVVNQALGAGLPIICTDAVGAAHDLVTDDGNGYVVPVRDRQALAEAIRRVAVDAGLRARFAEHSRRRSEEWTPDRGADRWVSLASQVLVRRRKRAGRPTLDPAAAR